MKFIIRVLLAVAFCVATVSSAHAAERIKVVATLSTFADLAKTIGGEQVEVRAVASPRFNAHFIEPKPGDVLRLKRADLFIHGGLDLEAWRGPLLDAAGNRNALPGQPGELDLSHGVHLLEVPDHALSRADGDIHLYGNPHVWLHPDNVRVMARAIAAKLSEMDPAHAAEYEANLGAFLVRLDAKQAEWLAKLAPFRGAELVGYHNEWIYFAEFAGLKMPLFLEPKPGIPPTPKHLETVEHFIRSNGVKAIVQSSYASTAAAESLAKRTGARVVVLCQNVGEQDACSDTIAMFDTNVSRIVEALGQ